MKYTLIVLFWFVHLYSFNAFADDMGGNAMGYPEGEEKELLEENIELLHNYGKILVIMENSLKDYPEGEEKELLKESIKELEETLKNVGMQF